MSWLSVNGFHDSLPGNWKIMSYVLQYCIQLYKIYVVFPLQVGDDSKNSKVSISQVIILIYFSCALYSYYIVG